MLLRELEAEKYWSFPASYSKEKRESEINKMILSQNYFYQLKTDGVLGTYITDFDGEKTMLGRGVSKVTHERTRYEDNLFFFGDMADCFDKPTFLLGEIWLEGGVDKSVGSIIRSKPLRAKCIQSKNYYEAMRNNHRFTPKEVREIEGNEFFNHKLRFRIFDVWFFNGEDLMKTPWIERQKYVKIAAERINNPLVSYVQYYPVDDNLYENLTAIFEQGGEGVVCYRQDGIPEPGKRTAHKTLKIKRELENLLDVFIVGVEPAIQNYTGKELGTWQYWQDDRTEEKIIGELYGEYRTGRAIHPITKGFYHNWPGAIYTAVYDKEGNEIPICKVSGLTEDFKIELRDNFEKYDHCPITIGGMALSDSNGISVRHPYLHSIRLGDIDIKDCTLEKILS